MRSYVEFFVATVLLVVLLGCDVMGEASSRPNPDHATAVAVVPVATSVPVEEYATITPWPTFTPVPTATSPLVRPTLGRASTGAVTLPPSPTPVPTLEPTLEVLPTVSAQDVEAVVPVLLATPTRSPYQLVVPGTDVGIRRQALFMSQVSEPPGFWPQSQTEFYTRTARYIGWFIELDYSEVGADFRMDGLLRWLNVTSGGEHVIFQRDFVMDASEGETLFFMTGQDQPGFWTPGEYRVELWDNRDRVVIRYDFTVLSGVVQ